MSLRCMKNYVEYRVVGTVAERVEFAQRLAAGNVRFTNTGTAILVPLAASQAVKTAVASMGGTIR